VRRERPDGSPVGIAIAALSLVVMPLLARVKRRIALAMGSRALAADIAQCARASLTALARAVVGSLTSSSASTARFLGERTSSGGS
jgi:divalent metal cation (Fe/Co/Zn/Cd) transporter